MKNVLRQDEERCPWCHGDDLYRAYHDQEWGRPELDPRRLFELLTLEGAQAGLSWITILRKREAYRQAFDYFDPEKVALYTERDVHRLLNNKHIVRNQLKIRSAINNAQCVLTIEDRMEFSGWIWSFVDHRAIINQHDIWGAVPATTAESERMSREMKRAGFNFVGPTICYAFMQATGMVNDHLLHCYRYQSCVELAREMSL